MTKPYLPTTKYLCDLYAHDMEALRANLSMIRTRRFTQMATNMLHNYFEKYQYKYITSSSIVKENDYVMGKDPETELYTVTHNIKPSELLEINFTEHNLPSHLSDGTCIRDIELVSFYQLIDIYSRVNTLWLLEMNTGILGVENQYRYIVTNKEHEILNETLSNIRF